MVIGISPTVDFAFKLMLGSPEHSRVTIHFLNAILIDQPKITRVEFLNPFLGKNDDEDKLSILDIRATDDHDRQLNIEMQTSLPAALSQRLAFYSSRLYASQLAEGEAYTMLRPAISICVLRQALFPHIPKLHLDFRLRDASDAVLTDDLQVHLLELSKLRLLRENVYHATPAERWAFFLRYGETLMPDEVRQMFPDPEIAEAAGVLEMISQTPEQSDLYEARLKFHRDEAARLEYARDQGRQEGRVEGRDEGRVEGRAEGRISILQELLGIPQSTPDELSEYDDAQLRALEERLRSELRARGN